MIGALQLPLWLALAAPLLGLAPLSAAPTATGSQEPLATDVVQASVSIAVRRTVVEAAEAGTIVYADFQRLAQRAAVAGIRCESWHPDCAARIGAFGTLDFVLIPRIRGNSIMLTLVDCTDGRIVRTVSGELPARAREREAMVASLARAALGTAPPPIEAAAPPDAATPPAAAAMRADTSAPSSTTDARAQPSNDRVLARVGVGALVVGALVGVGAGIGALAIAPSAERRAQFSAREYNDAIATGRALLVVSAAGLALGGAGAATWLVDEASAP